jgi:hypothetical protein
VLRVPRVVVLQEGEEPLLWCEASCGNNVHTGCFSRWAAAKRGNGQEVTCVFCRAAWQGEGGAAGVCGCEIPARWASCCTAAATGCTRADRLSLLLSLLPTRAQQTQPTTQQQELHRAT